MAQQENREWYENAVIDCHDMTLTEFRPDHVRSYSLMEILQRWSDIPNISIAISRSAEVPPRMEAGA